MRRELLLLVLLICSCGPASPMPSATPPQGTEPAEYTSPVATATSPQDVEPEEPPSPMPSATLPQGTEPGEYTSPLPTATAPPTIEAEEYVVYSALIQQNPTGYDLGSFFVIREQTAFGTTDVSERSLQEATDLPAGLVDSYRSRNAASYTLDPRLDIEQDYVLMAEDEWQRIFSEVRPVEEMWSDFEETYAEASGVVIFSRVGFSANGDSALAEMGYRCPGLCGAGGLYLLVKEDGDWKVQEALYEWMS